MCCAFLSLVLLGPRIFNAFWWLFQPLRWELVFRSWSGPWWFWPILGIVFVPWTTLMYMIVAPGGMTGFDWVWVAIMLVADLASYAGGVGRKQIPGYAGM